MRPSRFFSSARTPEPTAGPSFLIPWMSLLLLGLLSSGAEAQTYFPIEDAPTISPPGAAEQAFAVRLDSDVNTKANSDTAAAIVVDSIGTVFVAGNVIGTSTDRDFAVLSVTRNTGAERWTFLLDGGVGGTDRADALALDANGDVFAAGRLDPSGAGNDFALVKLNGSTGAPLWASPFLFAGDANGSDRATAVVVAANGDAIVGGEAIAVATGQDMLVCRVAASDGSQQWCVALDGTQSTEVDGDELSALVLDDAGDVIVAGAFENSTTGVDLSVVKLRGSTGAEVWRIDLDGLDGQLSPGNFGLDFANDLVFDGSGAVFVVGYSENNKTGFDMTVVKLHTADLVTPPGPRQIWRVDIDGNPLTTTILGSDLGTTIALDPNGDVFAGGSLIDDALPRRFFTVVKLAGADLTGQRVLWKTNVDGTILTTSVPTVFDIASDSNGDAIAVGTLENDQTNSDFSIVKIDGRTDTMAGGGSEIFRFDYIGLEPSAADFASSVAIDSLDGILVTGEIRQPQSGGRDTDIAIVKIPEPTGAILQIVALSSLAALARRRGRRR